MEADAGGRHVPVGGEIAEAKGITRSFVNRLIQLTLLAPNIQEAILDGRQSKGMQLEELTRAMPGDWEEQKEAIGRAARKGRAQAAVVATTDF